MVSAKNIVPYVALASVGSIAAYLVYRELSKKPAEITPGYPKTVSRSPYSFQAYNLEQEKQIKEFLGIEPYGSDLDTYIARLDATGLNNWETFWVNRFTSLNRNDMVTFVRNKAAEYRGITPPPPPPPVTPYASISVRSKTVGTRTGYPMSIIVDVKNTGTVSWTYGVGCTYRNPIGAEIDKPVQSVYLNPGETRSIGFDHTADRVGTWYVICAVWKESAPPLSTRLMDTGWLEIPVS